MKFQDEIINLINSKREGPYWDFKEIPHTNNSKLLHDIICMSNSICKHDKYIIIGVSDSKNGCIIKGLTGNRKKQSDYIDFIRSKSFAAENRPEIELRTIDINSYEIDVLIILDRPYKPYYLIQDYQGVKASYIYTRVGDTNTPINKSADFGLIEKMWRQQFGLNITPSEKYHIIIGDIDKWNIDIGNKKTAYYLDFPEYQIVFSDPQKSWEIYSYFFSNPSSYFGNAYFNYLTTTLFEIQYAFLDEFRIPIAVPNIEMIEINNESFYYYYYIKDSMVYNFLRLLGLKTLLISLKKECLPFIFFNDYIEKDKYNEHLKGIKNINNIIIKDSDGKYIKDKMMRDGYDKGKIPFFICFAVKEYYKWKDN